MAQVETTIGAESAAVENPEHATSGRGLSVHDPAATPKSSFAPSDNTKDEIGTQNLQTTGCTETSDCSNADRCSCAASHGEEHAESCRGLLPPQQTKPLTNHGAEATVAEPPVKRFGATDVTNGQRLPQPQAASQNDSENAIVIDDSDDENSRRQNDKGGRVTKLAKKTRKKTTPNNGSAISGDVPATKVDSTQSPSRSLRRTRRAPNKTLKSRAFKGTNQRRSSVTSKTVPPPTEDIVDEESSTGRPAETTASAPPAERDELQSGLPSSTSKPVTPQFDKTREATETDLSLAADADDRLAISQPEVDGDGARGDIGDTEALGHTDSDWEAEVGELDHVGGENYLQMQNGSRSAYARLGAKHQNLGKGQIDEIPNSDEEPDNESTSVTAREATMVVRESAKKRKAFDASTEIPKRRRTPGFSYQKIRPDVAFRASSGDQACAQSDDVPEESRQDLLAHREIDFGTEYGRTRQNGIGSSSTGGRAPQVDCPEVAAAPSDTTQDMWWPSRFPRMYLSNANLRDTSLGEGGSIKYEICGHWELTADGKTSLLGTTAMVWELSIFGPFELLRNDSTIDISFGLPLNLQPVLRPTVGEIQ